MIDTGNSKAAIQVYYFALDKLQFRLPSRGQYNALQAKLAYSAYFAPNSKLLLSFEPVGAP